jgi:hypothetical protein
MNQRSDIDRVLQVWMTDGPAAIPDRVVEVVAARIGVQRQRRAWPFPGRTTVNTQIKLIAALAAAIVLAVVGYNLLPGSGIGGPGPSPTPAPTATPAPAATIGPTASPGPCDEPDAICSGLLIPGATSTVAFQPKLTFTVPSGWTNTLDKARAYTIHYNFTRGHFLQLVSQLAIPDQTADCSPAWKTGAGNTVGDWVTFLTTHPGLEATAPKAVTIGGYEGMQLDLHVAADWTETCPDSLGPAVVLWTHSGAQPETSRWIDDQQTTFRIIDVAGETVIIYLESSWNADDLAALNTEFAAFFASFQFTPGG